MICLTCKFWSPLPDAVARDYGDVDAVKRGFGVCENPKLAVPPQVLRDGAYLWDGAQTSKLYTGSGFGCIHHQATYPTCGMRSQTGRLNTTLP